MNATLTKLSLYKEQIIGDKAIQHERRYKYLKQLAAHETDKFKCFLLISKLFYSIKSKSLGLTQSPYELIRINPENPFFIEMQTQEMARYKHFNPKANINVDSLNIILDKKRPFEIEGIYHLGNLKAGVYRTEKKDSLVGVIIESGYANWEKGDIVFILYESMPNVFNSIESVFFQNNFMSGNSVRFINGRLGMQLEWYKFPNRKKYMYPDNETDLFVSRPISDEIHYIRLGNFSSGNKVGAPKTFHQTIKNINASNIIVDFRSNSFGSAEIADFYLKLLKKKVKENNLYILINYRTTGVAEQLIVDIKDNKKIVLLGENTNGNLSSAVKNGQTICLPCYHDSFKVIDQFYNEYLEYEGIGITPNVLLTIESDWIEQTINIINEK